MPAHLRSLLQCCISFSCSLVTPLRIRFVYYLSKYWELLDSLFQLQKARSLGANPPGFLHYFHHAAVMVLLLHFL
jgi:hypothetical protein